MSSALRPEAQKPNQEGTQCHLFGFGAGGLRTRREQAQRDTQKRGAVVSSVLRPEAQKPNQEGTQCHLFGFGARGLRTRREQAQSDTQKRKAVVSRPLRPEARRDRMNTFPQEVLHAKHRFDPDV